MCFIKTSGKPHYNVRNRGCGYQPICSMGTSPSPPTTGSGVVKPKSELIINVYKLEKENDGCDKCPFCGEPYERG